MRHASPGGALAAAWVAWKAILLAIAASSPGLGYDTSSSLALPFAGTSEDIGWPSVLSHLIGKLTRWDAIYFCKVANRGYLFEQEWAWGWGFTQLIALVTAGLRRAGIHHREGLEAIVAISIAHFSHLLSVFALYGLTCALFPAARSHRIALTTALLHIISPAGLFLSAPYAESSCALLSFLGCLIFTKSFVATGRPTIGRDVLVLASGITFGVASTFRSNGILNGLLFVEEAFSCLLRLQSDFSLATIRRLLVTGLGGISIAVGFLFPQYIAYTEFCLASTDAIPRPWCQKTIPSIYAFVQEHYWNVGLFNYWTLSNLPLFLLATPMFVVMILSGIWGLKVGSTTPLDPKLDQLKQVPAKETVRSRALVRNMAVSQLLLTLITLTGAHVQIITRISTAYPVWMWYIGHMAADSTRKTSPLKAEYLARFMVVYAMIQGGLFASFLPPA